MGYRPVVTLLLLLGCLEPFPTDRHDLVELRIAAMGAADDGSLRAYTWEGTDAWSTNAPVRTWGGDAACDAAGLCTMAAAGTATLTITGADGATESGELTISDGATHPALAGFTRTLTTDGGSLDLDVPDAQRVHFMAPAGEFAESGPAATAFTAPEDGIWPVVALWMDGLGGNGWGTFDLPVGVDGPFLAVGGRLFPVETTEPEGAVTVLATITATDDLTGFSLTDVALDDGTATADEPCGTTAGVWNPDSVIERVCGRDQVAGTRVRLVGEVTP